jgi:hypothetical protein
LFWSNWSGCPFPVYLGTEDAIFQHPSVTTLTAGHHAWSRCLKENLTKIPADYILLLLEDFFLTKPINTAEVAQCLRLLQQLRGTVLRLHPQPGPDKPIEGHRAIGQLDRLAPYRVSLQAAIWNRAHLSELLEDSENIWDFECRGTRRSQALPDGFYSTYKTVIPYRHVVERGQWFRSAARYFVQQNIGCDFSQRPIMSSQVALRKAINRFLKNQIGSTRLQQWVSIDRE